MALAPPVPTDGHGQVDEGPFSHRMNDQVESKRAIARAAATLFAPGETLFVDTGSTTIHFAAALSSRENITVITNSSLIAEQVASGRGNSVYLIGGKYRSGGSETLGPIALHQVELFTGMHVVLTVGGIDADGIFDFDIDEAELAKAMVARGRILTVLVDSTKFNRTATFKVAGLSQIARLVVDRAPPPSLAAALTIAGVEVVIADEAPGLASH